VTAADAVGPLGLDFVRHRVGEHLRGAFAMYREPVEMKKRVEFE
jgi:hypothetical protein